MTESMVRKSAYRDVLNTIHANYTDIPFSTGVVLQFHRDLYQFLPTEGGKWKPVDNEITENRPDVSKVVRFHPIPAHQIPEAMETLHRNFDSHWKDGEIEPLPLIPAKPVMRYICIALSDSPLEFGNLEDVGDCVDHLAEY